MVFQAPLFILSTVLLIQAAALFQSWRQSPEEICLRDWGISETLMAGGTLLVLLGLFITDDAAGSYSPFFALLVHAVSAGVTSTGWFLAWLGTRRFYYRPAFSYWLVPAYAIVLVTIMMSVAHLPGFRIVMLSSSIATFSALIVLELYRDISERNAVINVAGIAMVFFTISWAGRGLFAIDNLHLIMDSMLFEQMCIYSSIVVSMVFTYSLIMLTNLRVHQRLRDQASFDPLTGALNRRAFVEASKPSLAALRREAISLAVCAVDLDHFKKINDDYGHAVGDRVLQRFTSMAHDVLREGDLFARYGGEEFVILMQHNDMDQATQAIERLREAWSTQELVVDGAKLKVTFSAGISHAHGPVLVTLEELLKAADDALFEAKHAGRNRILAFTKNVGTPECCYPRERFCPSMGKTDSANATAFFASARPSSTAGLHRAQPHSSGA